MFAVKVAVLFLDREGDDDNEYRRRDANRNNFLECNKDLQSVGALSKAPLPPVCLRLFEVSFAMVFQSNSFARAAFTSLPSCTCPMRHPALSFFRFGPFIYPSYFLLPHFRLSQLAHLRLSLCPFVWMFWCILRDRTS